MKSILFYVVIMFGILTLASSCIKSGDVSTPTSQGALTVANFSPDAPGINISLNSTSYITNLGYKFYTPYAPQTAGSYNVGVAGTSGANIFSNTINIDPNKYYSYFVIDSFAKLKYAFIEDNLIVPSMDSVYIRFLNFSPNAGLINFRDSASGNYFSRARMFNDQNTQSAYSAFTRIPMDSHTFQIVASNNDSTVLASQKYDLMGGHIYTILARGFLNGTDTQALEVWNLQNY